MVLIGVFCCLNFRVSLAFCTTFSPDLPVDTDPDTYLCAYTVQYRLVVPEDVPDIRRLKSFLDTFLQIVLPGDYRFCTFDLIPE